MARQFARVFGGIVFGVLWAALITEIGLRVMMARAMIPDRAPADIFATHPIGWALEPAIDAHIAAPIGLIGIRTNDQGFRDQNYPPESDQSRLLILGDSFTLALETPETDVFHVRLEQQLDQAVISLGVSGYELTQYLLSYTQVGIQYHAAQVLVMLYIGNDLTGSYEPQFPHYTLEADQLVLTNYPYTGAFDLPLVTSQRSTFFMRNSALAFIIGSVVRRPPTVPATADSEGNFCRYWAGANYPNPTPEHWALNEALLTALRDAATTQGATLRVAIIPGEIQIEPDDLAYFLESDCAIPDYAQAATIQAQLAALLTKLDIPYLDLLPGLQAARTDQDLYTPGNDIHWTPAGHAVVSDLLFNWLKG